MHIDISATAKSLCPSCKSQQQRGGDGVDYTVYCCIIFQTILQRILSSLQIAFCTVVYAMGCMGMSYYDASHMEYGSMSHGATALVAFPPSSSMFLPLVFLYLILLRSSVSPVTIDYRSLPVSFRLLLKPSMPVRILILSVVHWK